MYDFSGAIAVAVGILFAVASGTLSLLAYDAATGLYGPVDIGRAAVLCISGYIALCVAVYAVVYAFRPSQNDD